VRNLVVKERERENSDVKIELYGGCKGGEKIKRKRRERIERPEVELC